MIVIEPCNSSPISYNIDICGGSYLEVDVNLLFTKQRLIVSIGGICEEDIDTNNLLDSIGNDFSSNPPINNINWEKFDAKSFEINGKKYLQIYFCRK